MHHGYRIKGIFLWPNGKCMWFFPSTVDFKTQPGSMRLATFCGCQKDSCSPRSGSIDSQHVATCATSWRGRKYCALATWPRGYPFSQMLSPRGGITGHPFSILNSEKLISVQRCRFWNSLSFPGCSCALDGAGPVSLWAPLSSFSPSPSAAPSHSLRVISRGSCGPEACGPVSANCWIF